MLSIISAISESFQSFLSFQNKKNKMTIKKIIQDQEKIITWFSICPQV
jgi:hypothetical protein